MASLTLEAALSVPVFLFAVLNLLGMMEIFDIQMRLQAAIHQTARRMAVEGYAYRQISGSKEEGVNLPTKVVFSESYVRTSVQNYVTASVIEQSVIDGGCKGMLYSFSRLMEKDRIELIVVYRVAPRFSMIPFGRVWTMSQAKVRAFTGYDNRMGASGGGSGERYVYVTESGSVYHLDRGCRHLKRSVKLTDKEQVKMLRNEDGSRYRPCRHCHAAKSDCELLVITDRGDRYHTSVTCPDLKRTIRMIPLDDAGAYRLCADCASAQQGG
ncbi:MAG: hypothetical protein J6P60_01195 [Lachnospiraceae bacterium]|nr:hypothetical protein [Lachnospiraceae bacterium]